MRKKNNNNEQQEDANETVLIFTADYVPVYSAGDFFFIFSLFRLAT